MRLPSTPAQKPKAVQDKWASAVVEEFFAQGDREKALGLPVSPGFDRNTATLEMVQARCCGAGQKGGFAVTSSS